jgi:alpha-beta hydrolase superfamily lysophospholipase
MVDNQTDFSLVATDGIEIIGSKWMPNKEASILVLAIHGHGEHIGRFKSMADYFNQNSIGFMGIDLRGHGRSGGKRGHTPSYEVLLDDVGLLIGKANNEHPGIPLFLYGHSMGGNIATNYLLKRDCSKVTGAILSSPWYRLAFEPPAFKVALGKLMNGIFPAFTQSSELDTTALCSDPTMVKAYEEDPLVHDKISAGLFFTVYSAGLWALENVDKLKLPALLTHGDQDSLTSSDASKEFATRAGSNLEFKLWEGYMHEPHNEPGKDKVFEYMSAWMNSLLNAT